ncbi:MAG: 5-bromo-4-chloroindolyl phosphate hydrolysis family protein [Clostridia bacterium]|nr:5-bromo-4-chloroindolyl phosphate hydrolysis family protein [Clostridia bacterium]
MKLNPKKIKHTLDYLPRWAWYLGSVCISGPIGPLAVYLTFHVLDKMIDEYEEESGGRKADAHHRRDSSVYQDEDCIVGNEEELERLRKKTQASAKKAQASQKEPVFEDGDVTEVIRSGREALRKIRHANDMIPDPLLSAQIDSIETSCSQILSILEQRPQLLTQLRTFLRYYLPTTLRLLDARAKLENTANTPKAKEIRRQISEALGVIDKAFLKQVEALDEYRFIDLESEMDVLRDMMRADGLIDEDEEAKQEDDPFADALSQKYGKPMGGR